MLEKRHRGHDDFTGLELRVNNDSPLVPLKDLFKGGNRIAEGAELSHQLIDRKSVVWRSLVQKVVYAFVVVYNGNAIYCLAQIHFHNVGALCNGACSNR